MANKPDLLVGLTTLQRMRKVQEDIDYISKNDKVMVNEEGMKLIKELDNLKQLEVVPYTSSEEVNYIICARLDLDNPLYYTDNVVGFECTDCGCDLQRRLDTPEGIHLCICCAARRIREKKEPKPE